MVAKLDLIAVDKLALEQIAQQLESRMIEPSVLARELRSIVADARPALTIDATKPYDDLVADLQAEIRSYGGPCRCGPKGSEKCRRCRTLNPLTDRL